MTIRFPTHASMRFIATRLGAVFLLGTALQAGKSHDALHLATRSVMPIAALETGSDDYRLLGNALLLDDAGHLVAPSRIFRDLPVSLLLPVSRVGALVPTKKAADSGSDGRVFQRIQVLHLDEAAGLALLRLEGPQRSAAVAQDAGELRLGDRARIFGYGAPDFTRWVFQANVSAEVTPKSVLPPGTRYALDARVTAAADGGVLFDSSGKIHALTLLHLRSVHRVVHKLGAVELGPPGTAVGVPLAAIRSWAESVKPPGTAAAPKR